MSIGRTPKLPPKTTRAITGFELIGFAIESILPDIVGQIMAPDLVATLSPLEKVTSP